MSELSRSSQCLIFTSSDGTYSYLDIELQSDIEIIQKSLIAQGFMIIGTRTHSETQEITSQTNEYYSGIEDSQYRR